MGIWDSVKKYGGYALGGGPGVLLNKNHRDKVLGIGDESESAVEQRKLLQQQSEKAGTFADTAQTGFGAMGTEAAAQRDYLRRLAAGQDSVSAEQLRQVLLQNLAAQRSMAASAPPGMQSMAARTAMMQMGRAASGLAGQQALAGLQERQSAQKALADMILQQRQQDMQAALGARQAAITGYGGYKPEASTLEKLTPALQAGMGGLQMFAASDERLKRDVKGADKEANKALDGLRAFTYRYKDEKFGKGKQFGIMAQDLERAGLGHAVEDTPSGKMVHGAKLATSNTAMLAALADRVKKLERGE